MSQRHISATALVLAVTTSAWAAGIEPYPNAVQAESASITTREQVVAELREAQRLGQMTSGEAGYPRATFGDEFGSTSTLGDSRQLRARIHAETIEAARLGLLGSGEGNPPIATAEQEKLITVAGNHAVDDFQSAQRTLRTAGK